MQSENNNEVNKIVFYPRLKTFPLLYNSEEKSQRVTREERRYVFIYQHVSGY